MHVHDVSGHIEFVTRHREHEQESKVGGGGKSSSKETIFEENIKLELDGFVYHPNLMEFTVAGLFGLVQQENENIVGGRKRTSSDDGPVTEFDFRGSFFKKKKYPGTVTARRYRAIEPRPFQTSLEVFTTSYGATWRYVDEKTPTSLQFTHTDVQLDPRNDFEEEGRQKNTLFRFETAYRFTEYNVLSLLYTRESVDEQPFDLSYDQDEVTLSHVWDFGPQHRQSLESEVDYFDQRGTFNVERVRWREILRLKHSETLRSWYQLEVLDRNQGSLSGVAPIDERSYSLIATLEHKLYRSLISQFTVYGQVQEFGRGLDIDRYGAEASFDYRKKNPWGALLANYRVRYQVEDHKGGGQNVEVLDERHTFRDPEPGVLNNTRVDSGTIHVTAEDRTTVYRVNEDYTVRVVGDSTELRRVPTGRILDGQTVLIDYIYAVGGSFELDTFSHFLRLRQKFDFGLSPYYRLTCQDQTVTPAGATGVTPEDITAHIIGVDFERGPLRLSAEYEDHDSTINPFTAIRLTGRLTRRFQTGARGMIRARLTDVDRGPPNERETVLYTLEGRYRHPITRNLNVEGTVLYRNEDDSLTGDDEGIEVDLALEWDIRQTEVRVLYEFRKFDDDFASNEASALYVRFRRRF
ncbi:MAG: hypothetical protein ACYTFA_16445 [Planctomycetota bacterium]|jgi:hypothetical protein